MDSTNNQVLKKLKFPNTPLLKKTKKSNQITDYINDPAFNPFSSILYHSGLIIYQLFFQNLTLISINF